MNKKIEGQEPFRISFKDILKQIKSPESEKKLFKLANVILRNEYHYKARADIDSEEKKKILAVLDCAKTFYAMASSLIDKFKNEEFTFESDEERVIDIMLQGQWLIQHLQLAEREVPLATYQVKGKIACAHGIDRDFVIQQKGDTYEMLFLDCIIDLVDPNIN